MIWEMPGEVDNTINQRQFLMAQRRVPTSLGQHTGHELGHYAPSLLHATLS